eukprot:scaffold11511_cov116-Isochrysis_galbana.AAC.2
MASHRSSFGSDGGNLRRASSSAACSCAVHPPGASSSSSSLTSPLGRSPLGLSLLGRSSARRAAFLAAIAAFFSAINACEGHGHVVKAEGGGKARRQAWAARPGQVAPSSPPCSASSRKPCPRPSAGRPREYPYLRQRSVSRGQGVQAGYG